MALCLWNKCENHTIMGFRLKSYSANLFGSERYLRKALAYENLGELICKPYAWEWNEWWDKGFENNLQEIINSCTTVSRENRKNISEIVRTREKKMQKNNIHNDFVTAVKLKSNYPRQVRPSRRDLLPATQCTVAYGNTTWENVLQTFPWQSRNRIH